MKHFLKSLALLVIIFIILYPILVILWGSTGSKLFYSNVKYGIDMDGQMFTRLLEAKNVRDIDVLILGSSHAFRGIDARIFEKRGILAFNIGSSSQTPLQTKLLLKRYLNRINPKLIIYEVTPYFLTTDGVESALNLIGCDKNDDYSIEMARSINNFKVYNTLFYGFVCDFLNLNSNYKEPDVIGKNTYIQGGYVESELSFFKQKKLAERTYEFKELQIRTFKEVLSIIDEKNIPYILIDAPVTNCYLDSYTNKHVYDSIMNKSGSFYDFNSILSLTDSIHFYDADHLNQLGVEIFTNKLIDIIEEDCFDLPYFNCENICLE